MFLPKEMQGHPSDVHAQGRRGLLCCSLWGLWMECAPQMALQASIWGILMKGNMMLQSHAAGGQVLSPSALFLWEGRRRWSWKPQEQLMALP